MTILVAGSTGQMARALAQAATERNVDLIAAGRPELDLTRIDTLLSAIDRVAPNCVVNAAAYTAVDRAETDVEAAMAVNRDGARLLADACHCRDIPLVHLSTDYVFNGAKPEAYVETDEPRPLGVYGRSKLEGEQAVAAAQPRHIILRTAWLHSAYGDNFTKTMLRLGRERDTLNVVADQQGNPTYAPHLADCILDLVAQLAPGSSEKRWGTYHAAGTGAASWYEFALEIFANTGALGGPCPTVHPIDSAGYPKAARRPMNARLDCRKLADRFGLQLPDWRLGVRACAARLTAPTGADH